MERFFKSMRKSKNVISQYEDEYNGTKVLVNKLKTKSRKVISNARINTSSCPNCLSRITLDECGLSKCSGDRLLKWEKEFVNFSNLQDDKKVEYLKNVSLDSMFLELYDRWSYSLANPEDKFDCGFTNKIFFPIPSCSVTIPDPAQIIKIERKLGRKLTEDEIMGEKELFEYKGSIYEEYRKGARTVSITLLRFPEECY